MTIAAESCRGDEIMESVYFDECAIGMLFQTALSDPITEKVIEPYFALTNDRFGIHTDAAFAKSLGMKGTMVPGNLVVAIATGQVYQNGHFSDSLVVQAKKTTSFIEPLYVGERIYVVDRIVALEDRATKPYGRVLLERQVLNEAGKMIQRIEQDYRVLKRSALAAVDRSCKGGALPA
jgi:acyl dehydratase